MKTEDTNRVGAGNDPAFADQDWLPKANPWLIAIAVMLATFIEVLDTSVANVALPQIAGSLSATSDQATWVLTSYLISNAIVLPITGWLAVRFGRKRFLMTCIAIFTVARLLCGMAPTLGALIIARVVQGAAGGALQPISQAILMESFPREKRGMGMAVFAMGVVVAPILGPLVGGWITDDYSWRWIFYIHVPVCLLALYMCRRFIEDPPYVSAARQSISRIDYFGFSFLAIWLATLQVILDRGQQDDWFAAPWIQWAALISLVAMVCFIIWELREKEPIVDLRVLKNANFALGTALMTIIGVVLYSTITIQPLFVQNLLGYTAWWSAVALSPRGMGAIAIVFFVGKLVDRMDNRVLIICGFVTLAFASYQLSELNLQISYTNVIVPNVILGFGLQFIFVPLMTLTMAGLPNEQMGNAAGIFNLMRNLGGSVGISVATTLLARRAQEHQTFLTAHFTPYNPVFQHYVQKLHGFLGLTGPPDYHNHKAYLFLYDEVLRQSSLMAYMDDFRFFAFLSLLCIPAVMVLRSSHRRRTPSM